VVGSICALALVALAACGDEFRVGGSGGITTFTATGGNGGGTVTTGGAGGGHVPGGVGAGTGGGMAGGSDAGMGGALPTGGAGGSGATGGGGGVGASGGEGGATSHITVSITNAAFTFVCFQPPADPLSGSFTIAYRNTGSAAGTATIPGTPQLWLDGVSTGAIWSFEVDPATSGLLEPNGEEVVVTHGKVIGTGDPNDVVADPCDYCGLAPLPLLYMVLNVDEHYQPHSRELDSFECVY
jgi:hypothetical protein